MRVRATISDGDIKTVVYEFTVNQPQDFGEGVQVALREFQREYRDIPFGDTKVSLETIGPDQPGDAKWP